MLTLGFSIAGGIPGVTTQEEDGKSSKKIRAVSSQPGNSSSLLLPTWRAKHQQPNEDLTLEHPTPILSACVG